MIRAKWGKKRKKRERRKENEGRVRGRCVVRSEVFCSFY